MFQLHLIGPRTADLALSQFPCVIGRASAGADRLNDLVISRRHCAFSLHEGRVFVEDLGSRNGTFLNGQPLSGAQPVCDGDRLQLGHLTFAVRLLEAPDAQKGPWGKAPPSWPAAW